MIERIHHHRYRSARLLAIATTLILAACTSGGGNSPSASTSGTTDSPTPTIVTQLTTRDAGYTLAAPVQRSVAVRNGGQVLIAGGLDASGATVGGVFLMNPTTGNLSNITELTTPVHDATGQMIGSRLFVFGGGDATGTNLVQVVDPLARTTSVVGHLPRPLSDLGSASVGGTTYLVGGYDGVSPRREIYATTDGVKFVVAGMLPVGLRYPAVASTADRVIIAGGQTASGPSSRIYEFDPVGGTVKAIGRLPAAVGQAAGFSLQGTVYVAGGIDSSGTAVSSVTAVDGASGTISSEKSLQQPLADAAVASGSQNAIFVGGTRANSTLDQVLVASVTTYTLAPATPSGSASTTATPSSGATDYSKVRPFAGLLLVADRGNNQLLVLNSKKQIVWRYPSPKLPPPPHPLYFPDDAFWVHGGHAILVNEEENNTLLEIAYPSGKFLWTYGHPRSPGSATGYLNQPDDVYPYPGGGVVLADAKNCRILFIDKHGFPSHQFGTIGDCTHGLPRTVGYPNGDTPLPNGDILISELDGHWVDLVSPSGKVIWARQVPGVVEPSDPQMLSNGTFMVASYASPGAVVVFDKQGKVLWYYHPTTGPGVLDHPSLAVPLPNGLVAVNDDYNHRVVLINPKNDKIVWQYGVTGVAGGGPGQLSFPDGMDLMLPGNVIPLHIDFPSTAVHRGSP
jgi:hypothetical protein